MNASQRRAMAAHRRRLAEIGMSRYEARRLSRDKELMRKLARRLTADDADAARLRTQVANAIGEQPPTGQQTWDALRRSPLAGVGLSFEREVVPPRDVELVPGADLSRSGSSRL